ncbi:MAG TPA: hypothetical protein VFJ29_00925 [Candidatus Kapabacteria bacterium]|nr:hypothetical protein [Candidatus Kapabacteria bacterium]
MRRTYFFFIISIIFIATSCMAQDIDPYEYPSDARSAALGEAFVAVTNTPAALFYNVAGLSQQRGIVAQYGSRIFPVSAPSTNSLYSSASAVFGSQSLGGIEVSYASHSYNDHADLRPRVPSITTAGPYDETTYDVTAGYAHSISPSMDAGIGLGYTHRNINGIDASAEYLNFGIRYHESLLKSNVPDEFSFGISLNHIGSPIHYESLDINEDLPRSFRAGIAWRIAQPDTNFLSNEFLSAMIAGQYKNVLNESNTSSKGYWSLGIEVGAWDVLYFRYGLQYRPFNSIYSYADNGQANVGGGLKLPVHKLLGFATPAYITADYAAVYFLNTGHEDIWTVGIHIDKDFIPQAPPDQQQDQQGEAQ